MSDFPEDIFTEDRNTLHRLAEPTPNPSAGTLRGA
jgi:hypothetical protein